MDGRHPDAIRIAATRLTNPARVAEFNRWYDTVHHLAGHLQANLTWAGHLGPIC